MKVREVLEYFKNTKEVSVIKVSGGRSGRRCGERGGRRGDYLSFCGNYDFGFCFERNGDLCRILRDIL